jgi:hypothetical protein
MSSPKPNRVFLVPASFLKFTMKKSANERQPSLADSRRSELGVFAVGEVTDLESLLSSCLLEKRVCTFYPRPGKSSCRSKPRQPGGETRFSSGDGAVLPAHNLGRFGGFRKRSSQWERRRPAKEGGMINQR